MVDTAMDLWVTPGQGFVPVQSAGYVDPDLVAHYAGGGYIASGDIGMAPNWYAAGSYPLGGVSQYPIGIPGSTLASSGLVTPSIASTTMAATKPTGAGINWMYVLAIIAVLAIAYYL